MAQNTDDNEVDVRICLKFRQKGARYQVDCSTKSSLKRKDSKSIRFLSV